MTKDLKFREELADLMEKYDVEMYIDIEQDYAGIQSAELRFDTADTYGSLVFSEWNTNVNCNDIRALGNEA